ncbi:MAG: transposase, partial [Chlamydiia bacterium]|nr:transposase [Chlamydiia bacterium]
LLWIMDAIETGLPPLQRVARTFLKYFEKLLNYFTHHLSNARTEGINNKIKTMKRQAYGYRDEEYFTLRLYHLHERGYSFPG